MLDNLPKDLEELKNLINNSENGIKICVKVCANSKKNSLEFEDNFIKLKISKPAVDGKANKEIINFLSDILNLGKNNITIIKGEKSSQKCLLIVPKTLII